MEEAAVLDDIIAHRDLDLLGADGQPVQRVRILVGRPFISENTESYFCPFQILGIGMNRVMRAGGVDSVQALQAALSNISNILWALNEEQKLAWLGQPGDIGFPDDVRSRK